MTALFALVDLLAERHALTHEEYRALVKGQTPELAAYAAFKDADGNVTRGDMILGLNRLSSLMWIMMIKLKAGKYECTKHP